MRMLEPAGKGNVCFVGNSRLSTFHFLLRWNETSTLPKTWQNGLMCATARLPTSLSLQQRGRGLPAATSGGHAALFFQSSLLLYFASFTWLNLGFTACISTGSGSAAWPTSMVWQEASFCPLPCHVLIMSPGHRALQFQWHWDISEEFCSQFEWWQD